MMSDFPTPLRTSSDRRLDDILDTFLSNPRGGRAMTSKRQGDAQNASGEVALRYLHPLRLQGMPLTRFTTTVNKILNGRIKLLTRRI